ncbi:Hypothetical protein Tpal_2316 [Trichococcus palustris]|uniref:HTH tetR-type domain-containing protein n=2 Tax=Trichococcus palustris TaxID=140314 RepID=A0A143YUX4_9LACT|nr:TetR/AcrR family transcriptional regulator [Trichococcus palustris]CZQ98808.1 Hypothetical protein Tpal_2316 [Trichococcus palustris]SFK93917.1 transcriptional regulator, TetR family [Trichococcus palustris]
MEKKFTTRQLQAIETKNRIKEKALELFQSNDYEKVSTTDICQSLNIAVGNFYRYYSSKEEILMESYPTFDNYVNTEFVLNNFEKNTEAIKYLIYKQTNVAEVLGAKIYAQMLRVQVKNEGKYVTESTRAFHTCLRKLVQNAIDDKEIMTGYSAGEISSLILRTSRGLLLEWAMGNGQYSVSEYAVHDIDMILNSMKCR